jgi:glycosyltransferase involved in cell wall biosynthesis
MSPRIAIDFTAGAWQGAGIGRYTRELIGEVLRSAPAGYRFVLFYAAGWPGTRVPYAHDIEALQQLRPGTVMRPIPVPERRLTQFWHRLRVPLRVEWLIGAFDLLHAPDFVLAPTAMPGIVTIHDLSYLVHPECAVPGVARYLRAAVPPSLARAAAIFADSVATQRDLTTYYGIDPARIDVVYAAVSARFQPLPDAVTAPIRRKYELPAQFILAGGTLEPRKNYVRLFQAYARARQRQELPPLVVFGRRGWMYEDILQAPARLGIADAVRFIDYLDDNDLPAVYNLAWAFVYPSLYEGFGLPPLEALACGTPTLVSNVSSLPEVVGNAALMVDPTDVDALAHQLIRLITDDDTRATMRTSGPVQAQSFSWATAAQSVLRQYAQLTQRDT